MARERDTLALLVGTETLLCFLACLTYFHRPDKLQCHETRLYVLAVAPSQAGQSGLGGEAGQRAGNMVSVSHLIKALGTPAYV